MVLFYRMSCVILKNIPLRKLFRLYWKSRRVAGNGFCLILKKRVRILKEIKVIKYASPIRTFRLGWQDGYHAEIIETNWFIKQKVNYIHNNPVKDKVVTLPEDYYFSSARNYAGLENDLDVVVLDLF